MPREKKNKKAIVFWILTVLVMGIIFFLSSRNADESTEQSNWLLNILNAVFGEGAFSMFVVRKLAHFSEFALLCFLFNYSFYFTYSKNKMLLSLGLTSLYEATDEFHQRFVEGRACQLTDWTIDTAGAVAGLLAFVLLTLIINKINQKKNTKSVK